MKISASKLSLAAIAASRTRLPRTLCCIGIGAVAATHLANGTDYIFSDTPSTGINWNDGAAEWTTVGGDDNTFPDDSGDNITGNTAVTIINVNGSYTVGDITPTTAGWPIQGSNGVNSSSLTFDELAVNVTFTLRGDAANTGRFTVIGRQATVNVGNLSLGAAGTTALPGQDLGALTLTDGLAINNSSAASVVSINVSSNYNLGLITTTGTSSKQLNLTQGAAGRTVTATVSGLSLASGNAGFTIRTSSNLASTVDNVATLRINNSADYSTNAVLENTTGVNSNAGNTLSLLKEGIGTQKMTGASTYTGGTTINGGTLLANTSAVANSALGTGAVTVGTGGTLGGTGFVSASGTTVSGAIAPGDGGIQSLDITNDLTWNGGVAWKFELAAANSSDVLNLTGAGSDLLKGTGSTWIFDFQNTGVVGQTYTLVDWVGTTGFLNSDFGFSGLSSGLTGTFTVNGTQLDFMTTAIPEPSAYVMIVSGLGMLRIVFRRRKIAAV